MKSRRHVNANCCQNHAFLMLKPHANNAPASGLSLVSLSFGGMSLHISITFCLFVEGASLSPMLLALAAQRNSFSDPGKNSRVRPAVFERATHQDFGGTLKPLVRAHLDLQSDLWSIHFTSFHLHLFAIYLLFCFPFCNLFIPAWYGQTGTITAKEIESKPGTKHTRKCVEGVRGYCRMSMDEQHA